ncbi:TonB-dependent receptor [Sphingobacterium sp. UT-1RO-CII-1]|uniref:SusC/RagA family TonB-linked outer membrane protein n=1 Tax=Sphingobacterium sp. UT-1RO-CII-1 TaxID=2995225 RepID=UPI00227CBFCE|nr:TonB-dependent receptor [Sphingobacterium sp. UT-1RO-CII-1]MCY4781725.1 TonB-dependent receptor [Sphingobacterium sp. UT-1RO-CII-1]
MRNKDLVSKLGKAKYCPIFRVSKLSSVLSFALLLSSGAVFAEPHNNLNYTIQNQTEVQVKGTVTSNARPVEGASISIKGNANALTKTDAAGKFDIRVAQGTILVITSIDYESVEVVAKEQLQVQLVEKVSVLDEMVVVGYGMQKKVNLTGAVDQISAKQLENRPVTSLGSALQGLMPNLNITNPSGNPSASAQFNIRGTTSINGGGPLILVDNVPHTEAEVARLNPNDFETVTILKDGSSAAIYGARAAFGVVLITTKNPTTDKVQVNFGYNASFRTVGKMPEVVTDPLTVMEYKRLAATPLYDLFPEAVREYAREIQNDPSLPRVIIDPTNKLNYMYYGSTDWMKEAYNKSAPTHTFNLSLGRRAENISYLFSGEYLKQDGMMKYGKDQLERYNARGKVDMKVTDWLNFGNNTLLTVRDFDSPVFMDGDFFWNVNRTSSLDVPKNPDGSWTSAGAGLLGRMQDGGRTTRKVNEFQTSFNAKASIIKNVWDVNADVTFRRSGWNISSFDMPIPYKTGPETEIKYAGPSTSYATKQYENSKYDVFNLYTNFRKSYGEHNVNALLGYNQEYSKYEKTVATRNDLLSTELPTLQLASGTTTATHGLDDWAVQGVFYRIGYDYKGKYLLESNGRYDGSSKFPDGDRWGFFPSASAGWVLSEESFFEPLKQTVNHFKFRASYGSLGNQNVSNYSFVPTMGSGKVGWVLGNERPLGLNPPGAITNSFTWEKVSTVNYGLDISMLNNRLDITADMYTRKTKDMLVKGRTLPGVFGTASPKMNAGDLKTEGWELRIGWKDNFDLAGSPFNYNAAFVLSNYKATITKYDNPTNSLGDYYVGQRLGTLWGYTYDGVFESQEQLDALSMVDIGNGNVGNNSYIGDVKYKDLTGDGRINAGKNTLDDHGDLKKVGNSHSQYPFSFDFGGEWKGISARVFLQGVGKRDWYPGGGAIYFWGIYAQPWTNVTKHNLDHWTPENPNGYFPAVRAYAAEVSGRSLAATNDHYMQDASYLRVKNITLGYSLPKQWIQKSGLGKVHFYFSGENLFEKTNLKVPLDPEGLNGNIYPFQRTYSFGMNVTF